MGAMEYITASVTGVIRMILILVALYFAVRLLGRFFGSRTTAHKQRARSQSDKRDNRKEGEVRIEYTDKSKNKKSKTDGNEGDYIDFEELD